MSILQMYIDIEPFLRYIVSIYRYLMLSQKTVGPTSEWSIILFLQSSSELSVY
jgi:hypothetical protein